MKQENQLKFTGACNTLCIKIKPVRNDRNLQFDTNEEKRTHDQLNELINEQMLCVCGDSDRFFSCIRH